MCANAIARAGEGVRNVRIDGKWGRIGLDGRWLLEPRFDCLSGGVDIFVASIGGKRGFMRSDGSWLIEPKFDAARYRNDVRHGVRHNRRASVEGSVLGCSAASRRDVRR
jgi:hypothetical protein